MKQTSEFFPKGVRNVATTYGVLDGTAEKTIFVAGADDSTVTAFTAHNAGTSAAMFTIYLSNGTTSFPLTSALILDSAGNNGTTGPYDFMSQDFAKNMLLSLQSGWSLKVAPVVAVAADVTFILTSNDY